MISVRPSLITAHHSVSSRSDPARETSPRSGYLRPARDVDTTCTVRAWISDRPGLHEGSVPRWITPLARVRRAVKRRCGRPPGDAGRARCKRAKRDFLRAGRVEVDVVDADPVTHDHAGPGHCGDDGGVDRGELDDHRVGVGHEPRQLRRGPLFLPGDDVVPPCTEDRLLDGEIRERVVG